MAPIRAIAGEKIMKAKRDPSQISAKFKRGRAGKFTLQGKYPKNLVLASRRGSFKYLLAKNVFSEYKYWLEGIMTAEIKRDGKRRGFEVITSGGEKTVLAGTDFVSKVNFNKYAVNMKAFDIICGTLENALNSDKIIFIDEIGSISLKSQKFTDLVAKAVSSDKPAIMFIREGTKIFEGSFSLMSETRVVRIDKDRAKSVKILIDAWFEFWIKSLKRRVK